MHSRCNEALQMGVTTEKLVSCVGELRPFVFQPCLYIYGKRFFIDAIRIMGKRRLINEAVREIQRPELCSKNG